MCVEVVFGVCGDGTNTHTSTCVAASCTWEHTPGHRMTDIHAQETTMLAVLKGAVSVMGEREALKAMHVHRYGFKAAAVLVSPGSFATPCALRCRSMLAFPHATRAPGCCCCWSLLGCCAVLPTCIMCRATWARHWGAMHSFLRSQGACFVVFLGCGCCIWLPVLIHMVCPCAATHMHFVADHIRNTSNTSNTSTTHISPPTHPFATPGSSTQYLTTSYRAWRRPTPPRHPARRRPPQSARQCSRTLPISLASMRAPLHGW